MMIECGPVSGDSADCTPSELQSSRLYRREFLFASLLYIVTMFVSIEMIKRFGAVPGALKVAEALLPLTGILAMTLAIVRFGLRLDELQRQSFFVSFALAAVVTGIVTMALGLLENAGLPRIAMTWVWPLTMLAFGISYPIVRSRYR